MKNNYGRTRWYMDEAGGIGKAALGIITSVCVMVGILIGTAGSSKPGRDDKRENNRGKRF